MKLSFQKQVYVSLAISAGAFLLANWLHCGMIYNAGWILVGLLLVINPVWPRAWDWKDHVQLKKGVRIAGIILIALQIISRYNF